jgi:hypothetical protein
MLPPHSGHTQFRMRDITSELSPTVSNLIACIPISMNDKGNHQLPVRQLRIVYIPALRERERK